MRREWINPHAVDVPFAGRHCGHNEYKRNATYHGETAMMNLPDEMILAICSKMNSMDVLYSLIGVNERLNRLAHDRIFTQSIELIEENDDGKTRSLPDLVLDRFCRQILPEIHTLVESLTVESCVVERSLSVGHYPRLTNLTLVNIDESFASRHFTGTTISNWDEWHLDVWFRELPLLSPIPKTDLVTEGHHCRSWSVRIDGWYNREYPCSDLLALQQFSGLGFYPARFELVLCKISIHWSFFNTFFLSIDCETACWRPNVGWFPLSTRWSSPVFAKADRFHCLDRSLRCCCWHQGMYWDHYREHREELLRSCSKRF